MNRDLIEAINLQAKREGFFWPIVRAVVFEQIRRKFQEKFLGDVLVSHRGGCWGSDQDDELLSAPSLTSPDIRHGAIDISDARIRYYTQKELDKHQLKDGDILVIKSNGSLDLVGKSQLFDPEEELGNVTASNFILVLCPDKKQIDPTYLDWFLKSPQSLVWRVEKQRTTTGLRNLDTKGYLATSIPVPKALKDQQEIVSLLSAISKGSWSENPYFDIVLLKKVKEFSSSFQELDKAFEYQSTDLGQLKQAILQEAIQGKLTEEWRAENPGTEPASELLGRIQEEKERLIKEKKIRKEKALPEITEEEIPFEVPNGWEWCHFGDIIQSYFAGKSFKCVDREVVGTEWGVLKTSSVTSGFFREEENKFYRTKAPDDVSTQVKVGDLIFCRASGSKGLAGSAAIVKGCKSSLLLSDKTIRISLLGDIPKMFVWFHNLSNFTGEYYQTLNSGKSTSMNNITKDQLRLKPFPLPPLAEQAAIVERVKSLMAMCDELEGEIKQSQAHAEDLLQAVLREAFAPTAS